MDDQEAFVRVAALAGKTVRRLQREGHPEAWELVRAVITAEETLNLSYRQPFNEARCIKRLEQLPDTNWSDSMPRR